jgi:hypothetical protein
MNTALHVGCGTDRHRDDRFPASLFWALHRYRILVPLGTLKNIKVADFTFEVLGAFYGVWRS